MSWLRPQAGARSANRPARRRPIVDVGIALKTDHAPHTDFLRSQVMVSAKAIRFVARRARIPMANDHVGAVAHSQTVALGTDEEFFMLVQESVPASQPPMARIASVRAAKKLYVMSHSR